MRSRSYSTTVLISHESGLYCFHFFLYPIYRRNINMSILMLMYNNVVNLAKQDPGLRFYLKHKRLFHFLGSPISWRSPRARSRVDPSDTPSSEPNLSTSPLAALAAGRSQCSSCFSAWSSRPWRSNLSTSRRCRLSTQTLIFDRG